MGNLFSGGRQRNPARTGAALAVVGAALIALHFSAVTLAGSGEGKLRDFKILHKSEMKWRALEEFPGIEAVFLAGNPSKAGPYVLLARFAPGVMSAPHSHDQDRHVMVLSGVWYAGTDASGDLEKTTALGPGDFMIHPAGGVHYDGAREVETIVQISGIGPVKTTTAGRE
ncbi:MAG: cupin domain-containing protein [Sphingomonadales bacterium]